MSVRADVSMNVCAACGIREPFDPCSKEVDLNTLPSDHWLQGLDDMELLCPGTNGEYDTVRIPWTDLHNLVEVGERVYHVVPEAVLAGRKVKLCKRCARDWDTRGMAKRTNSRHDGINDDFQDLYASNAPSFSIASGADYGRLSALRSKGIRVDVSTPERLLLAEALCHQIVYKIVAYGDQIDRKRLRDHSIVCPQHATNIDRCSFGKAALEAAFAAVRIVFVGSNGMQSKMEDVALKIEYFRLRPDVIFNFLTINRILHHGPSVPSIQEIMQLLQEHSLAARIKNHARHMEDTTIEQNTTPSDVANVRSEAKMDQHMKDTEDPEADRVPQGEALPPSMVSIGLFELEAQQMDAVLRGIEDVVTIIEGNTAETDTSHLEGDDVPVAAATGNARRICLLREDNLLNDYEGAADMVYKAWWPLLRLRRGFVKGKSIPDAKLNQAFLYLTIGSHMICRFFTTRQIW